MKRLILLLLFIVLFTISGCAQNSASVARKEAVRAEAKEEAAAKPKPVITAKDLKLQTKSSPIKKYNELSLREARQEQNANRRSQNNSSASSSNGGSYSQKNTFWN
jgi:hypothetical protein